MGCRFGACTEVELGQLDTHRFSIIDYNLTFA
jgi:hypothetical protein